MGYFRRLKIYARQYWEANIAPEDASGWILLFFWVIFYYSVYIAATTLFDFLVMPLFGLRAAIAPLGWLGSILLDTSSSLFGGMGFTIETAAVGLAWVATAIAFVAGPWATVGMGLGLIGLGLLGGAALLAIKIYKDENMEVALSQQPNRDQLPQRPNLRIDPYYNEIKRDLTKSFETVEANFLTYNYLTRFKCNELIATIEQICQDHPPNTLALSHYGHELASLLIQIEQYPYMYILDPEEKTSEEAPAPAEHVEQEESARHEEPIGEEENRGQGHRTLQQHTTNFVIPRPRGEEEEKGDERPGPRSPGPGSD